MLQTTMGGNEKKDFLCSSCFIQLSSLLMYKSEASDEMASTMRMVFIVMSILECSRDFMCIFYVCQPVKIIFLLLCRLSTFRGNEKVTLNRSDMSLN
jgi:hypothetical protein